MQAVAQEGGYREAWKKLKKTWKKFQKGIDKRETVWYNTKVAARAEARRGESWVNGHWKLNNKEISTKQTQKSAKYTRTIQIEKKYYSNKK